MDTLDVILQDLPWYRGVQEAEVLDRLLPHYLRNAEMQAGEQELNQGREVAKMIGKPDLSSRSVIFHEKCEIAAYLGLFDANLPFRYTEEEVRNGTAHRQQYHSAHDLAEKLELLMLQHVAKTISGREPPLWTIVPTRPAMELWDPTGKISISIMRNHLPGLFGVYSGKARFVPLEYQREDVEACFRMFEQFGSSYSGPKYKESVHAFVTLFVQDTNYYFRFLEEERERVRKQISTISAA